MKKSKKTVIITLSIVVALLAVFIAGRVFQGYIKDKLETEIFPLRDPISVINTEYERETKIIDWAFDVSDKGKLAGFADYVFIAEVKEVIGTGYTDAEWYDGFKFYAFPFTKYEIRVLENLKGELRTDVNIPLFKDDGIMPIGKTTTLYSGDMLPEKGECYIFLCKCDEDGELRVGNGSGFCDIYICKADEYKGDESLIDIYRDAIENMDESVRIGESYKSKYEIS